MINLLTTLKGSMLESFFPAAWNLKKWDACISDNPDDILDRQDHWNKDFTLKMADNVPDYDVLLGHELAMEITRCRRAGRKLVLILPVGPMGMYRWACYFLHEWDVSCDHVTGFAMDEWSDKQGNTLPADDPGSFQHALKTAFYDPMGEKAVPVNQRFFATREMMTEYADRIEALRSDGAKLVVVYGIGRTCHIAFWEPHFGEEFENDETWLRHPVTRHIPSTWMPTIPGTLFFVRELAGLLESETN